MLLLALLLALALPGPLPPVTASAATTPQWGVYTGPGRTGVLGAERFSRSTGVDVTHVLDFLPDDSWDHLTGADWLIDAYRGSGYQLELSVPMLPRAGVSTMAACANGAYDAKWATVARKLEAAGLDHTIVRPGWEANGDWYAWSARDRPADYIGCFRRLVSAMRAEAPGLRFSWTVASGWTKTDATLIYPGDRYVDVVGADVYDVNWLAYPPAAGTSAAQARALANATTLNASRGLLFWSAFSRTHAKPFAIPEWGMTWRADGHGGGDNPEFARLVLDFVDDPVNAVAYASYFDNPDSAVLKHNITAADTRFPQSRAVVVSHAAG